MGDVPFLFSCSILVKFLKTIFLGIFGRTVAFMHVVEYQKRGLPHAHILLVVSDEHRLRKPADVDNVISAELPPDPVTYTCPLKRKQAEQLRSVVLNSMVHGPCGSLNPNSPCMFNGKCSKKYPKALCSDTSWTQHSSYPLYRRRSSDIGGQRAVIGDFAVDNRWVVPYNPYLLLKYQAHINVEACISPFAAKYLFLYINKVSHLFFKNLFLV